MLLDTKTGKIYVPNTDQTVNMGEDAENPQGNGEGDDVTDETDKVTV